MTGGQGRAPGLSEAVDRSVTGPGPVRVEHDDGVVEVDVVEAGPVGVVVERLRVRPHDPAPLGARSRALARGLRPGGDRLVAVEVDEALGGATLRTDPRDLRGGRFFEVAVDADGAELRRHQVGDDGARAPAPFALTRDALGRAIDQMAAVPDESLPATHPLDGLLDR